MLLNPIPSYAMGWARNPGQALYPELWEGLVGYWDPSLGPTGLTLYDQSGYGNNGQIIGATAADAWVVGERGYALDYGGNNDYVNMGNVSLFDISGDTSWSFWVKLDVLENAVRFLIKGLNVTEGWLIFNGIDGDVFLDTSDGGRDRTRTSLNAIIAGKLLHITVVLKGTAGHIYIDGVEASYVQADAHNPPIGSTQSFRIGVPGGQALTGQIGPVSIYKIALPKSRIQLMAAGATPAMLAEDVILKAPSVGLLLKQSNMDGGMENLNGGFV